MTQETLIDASPVERQPARRANRLLIAAAAIALLVMTPVLSVIVNIFVGGTGDTWSHLASTVLPEYVSNTFWLCLGVGAGVIVVGVAGAWLVTMYDFPGRSVFEWALILPLAVPAYVMAYTYTDLLQFVGPVQTWLRGSFDWQRGEYWFPDIRSLGGAITMFIFVLYPYVYLLARTAFLERAGGMLEVGRSLGLTPWQNFFRVSFPLARPAVAAGTALALMETLADYGTVSYFAVQTFTTGIYRAWFSLGDRSAAAQLSVALLGFVVLVLTLERFSRGRRRFNNTTTRQARLTERRLTGIRAAAAWWICALPLAIGFLVPAGILLRLAWMQGGAQFSARYFQLVGNSFMLAAVTAVLAVTLSVLLAYAARTGKRPARWANQIVSLGYAVPGSVIAVGVLIPVTRLDNWLSGWIETGFGIDTGLLLTGGMAALIYAYLVRFLAVSLQTVEASLSKITPSMDDAARSLGHGHASTLARVHLPLLRASVLTSGLLVFVDVMKELPATLVMRPFNLDTLATQAYILVSDERLAEAAAPALTIVAVGVLPLIVISYAIAHSGRKKTGGD